MKAIYRLLFDPAWFWPLACLIVIGDVCLSELIIRYVSYTEIDWETYMVQTSIVFNGERDYSKISGPTGPLVYPAGHVFIHQILYYLTNAGTDIAFAQQIYAAVYTTSLLLTCAIYRAAGGLPNWILLLLPLSKRLHSIYLLRLFNDCWAVLVVQMAIFSFQKGFYDTGILLFSAALSIKMSILLYFPGVLVLLIKSRGLAGTLRYVITILATQALFAKSFLVEYPWSYFQSSFDFSRTFLYKWTVNWRFLDEPTFLSSALSKTLLTGHVVVLVIFGLHKWCHRDGGVWSVLDRSIRHPSRPAALAPVTADEVAMVLFTSNLIGIVFARSLHYQFYSWYAHQLPFLAWRTRFPLVLKLAILAAVEYAWNVFPSTPLSSGMLSGAHLLLLTGVYYGYSFRDMGNRAA